MAITRAQQAKQMLQDGGMLVKPGFGGTRQGYRGPGGYQSDRSEDPATGAGVGASVNDAVDTGDLGSEAANVRANIAASLGGSGRADPQESVQTLQRFLNTRKNVNVPTFFGQLLKKPIQKFADFNAAKNRNFFQKVIGAGKLKLGGKTIDLEAIGQMTDEELEDTYKDYLSARLNNEIDAYGNPLLTGDDESPLLFPRSGIMAQAPEEKKEEDDDPINFRLLAEGGRAGFQEGGGIEQRLEKLGGDVSSAEQMLQGINQRLKTAESSLGSGGGGLGTLAPGVPTGLNRVPEGPMQTPPGSMPVAGPPNFDTAFGGAFKGLDMSGFKPVLSAQQDVMPFSINGKEIGGMNSAFVGSLKNYLDSTGQGDAFSVPGFTPLGGTSLNQIGQAQAVQQARPGLLPNTRPMGIAAADGTMSLIPNPLSPQQQMEQANAAAEKLSPEERVQGAFGTLQNRAMKTPQELAYLNRVIKSEGMDYLFDLDYFTNSGLRAGGGGSLGIPAAGFADGGNVVGGEYDFESARQMYGLGKLVKKITKSVKKIAKSPIGKIAIGAALFNFGKPLFTEGGAFNKFFFAGKAPSFGALTTKGALTGIAGISALGGLTAEEDDEEQQYAGADFPNPVDFYLSGQAPLNTRLAAEGGLMRAGYQEGSKEPVAKKTMPLLDMGGMEKDYREEGGFVPIGRMEKADDVPARLSKNEFVFTADAVRNAGDGDVDLGAEKMYNMMKNLEAGGDVSEESQGLKGAREMFQTSQRLEEVL